VNGSWQDTLSTVFTAPGPGIPNKEPTTTHDIFFKMVLSESLNLSRPHFEKLHCFFIDRFPLWRKIWKNNASDIEVFCVFWIDWLEAGCHEIGTSFATI
jgi:hypothetical protein